MMRRRLVDWCRRRRLDADLDAQLTFHLEALSAEFRAQGLTPEQADAAARRAMGGLTQVKDDYRDLLRIPLYDAIGQDLRHGWRVLRRNAGFSLVALSILTIGIAAATTIFSFVDAVLLRPLPYAHSDRIVRLLETRPTGATSWVSTPAFLDWQRNANVFDAIAAQQQGTVTMTRAGDAVPLRVGRVTADYFDVFGVAASLGRTFTRGEDVPGHEHVVVLGHGVWQSQFGSDSHIVGRTIVLDNEPFTVIGVLPADTAFDRGAAQIWQPLAFTPANQKWDYHWLNATFARLKPQVSLAQARAQMNAIGTRTAAENPSTNTGWGVAVDRYADAIVGPQLRTSLWALTGGVFGLVLICCANLASLILVRGLSRSTELSVRIALGASRRRIALQLFVEHAMLMAGGGVLGLAGAYASIAWLGRVIPKGAIPSEARVQLDLRVVMFALGLSVLSGVVFGLLPALGRRLNLAGGMRARTATPSAERRRVLDGLVIAEVAIAFALLCGSALLVRSLVALMQTDPGFVSTNVLTMRLPVPGLPPGSRFKNADEFKAYLRAIEASVDAIPGVRSSALSNALPLTDCCLYTLNMQIANRPAVDRAHRAGGFFKVVTPSYFRTMGLTLKRGRFLDEHDAADSRPVIVINERLANRYFDGNDPVGQHILNPALIPGKTERGPDVSWEIVGVVGNERTDSLNDDASAVLYASYDQSPVYFATLAVRSTAEPRRLEGAVRRALFQINHSQAVLDVRTADELKSASIAASRVQAVLMTTFSMVALILAAIGIYGVLAYSVALRSHEIAIRAALGADSPRLLRAVLRRGLAVTTIGMAIGLVSIVMLAPLLSSLLDGVPARDPSVMTLAAVTMIVVALSASLIPARRAARVDPIGVMRADA